MQTLAYALPILSSLVTERERRAERGVSGAADDAGEQQSGLRALILTPTRELAGSMCAVVRCRAVDPIFRTVQVASHIEAAAHYCDIRIAPVIGGMSLQKQVRHAHVDCVLIWCARALKKLNSDDCCCVDRKSLSPRPVVCGR